MVHEVISIRDKNKEDYYFTTRVKTDPLSSYHYNILIMLAKRFLEDEKQKEFSCKNRWALDKKLVRKIVTA